MTKLQRERAAVDLLRNVCAAAQALIQQVAVGGSVDGNPAAIKLNTAVKLANDWFATLNRPEPQPKIKRTTWA